LLGQASWSILVKDHSPAMSVLVETSLGDIVVDLEVEKCPKTCDNFLKLCKVKYYGLNAFFNGELRVGGVLWKSEWMNSFDVRTHSQ